MPRIYKDGVLYNTAPSTASQLPYDSNTFTKDKIDSKADSSSLASPSITGSTNNTGSTIKACTFFYLNGSLVMSKTDISNGATLTSGTNYETVTAGGLNELPHFAKGSISYAQFIAGAYVSASGNYCSFSVPCLTKSGSTATISFDNAQTGVFLPTGKLTSAFDTTYQAVTRINDFTYRVELKFNTTQQVNTLCTLSIINMFLNVT